MRKTQTQTKLRQNRKGQVGLDTGKAVMLSLLFIGILGALIIILLANLTNTNVATTSGTSNSQTVDTVVSVNQLGDLLSVGTLKNCVATVIEARNVTGLALIPATNYTVSGCSLSYPAGQGNPSGFNNSNWQVNYTYTYNAFGSVNSNISTGTTTFFTNTSTWFSLLAIVVIISIIAIVIFAVNRFGGKDTGF